MFVQPYQRIAVITFRVHSIIQDLKTNTQEPKKKKMNASFSHRLQALKCLSIIDGHFKISFNSDVKIITPLQDSYLRSSC